LIFIRCVPLLFLCSLWLHCRRLQVPQQLDATTDSLLIQAAIPPDQPSKRAVGNWDDAYTKATAALAKLSQSEKIGIVTGVGWQNGPCVGNTKAAGSIGYPSLCLQGKQSCSTTSQADPCFTNSGMDGIVRRNQDML
jgi:hypothetical protein